MYQARNMSMEAYPLLSSRRPRGRVRALNGFNGMTAALIGKDSTLGIIFGSLILGALQSGAVTLSVETSVQAEMVQVVKGFVMLFATINILRYLLQSRRKEGKTA